MSLQGTRVTEGSDTLLCYAESAANPLDRDGMRRSAHVASPALLPYVMARPGTVLEARWTVTGLVTLEDRLASPFTGAEACALMERIALLIDTLIAERLPIKNVVLNPVNVFMDPAAPGACRFIYLPFQGIAPNLPEARAFFAQLGTRLQPADELAADAVRSYAAFFQGQGVFDIMGFSRHLKQLTAALACEPAPAAGTGEADDSATTVLAEPDPAPDDQGTTVLSEEAAPDDSGTTVLEEEPVSDDSGTTVLADADGAAVDDSGTTVLTEEHARNSGYIPPKDGTTVLGMIDIPGLDGVEEEPAAADEEPLPAPAPVSEPAAAPEPEPVPVDEPEPAPEPVSEPASEPKPATDATSASEPSAPSVPAPEPVPPTATAPAEPAPAPRRLGFFMTRLNTGERFQVLGRRFVVGKSKHSTFQVKDTATVSRSHAILSVNDNACTIMDDESRNGTFVNGERLESGVPRRLSDGDTVRLSDVDFVFEAIPE